MPYCHAFAKLLGAGINIDEGMAMDVDVDVGIGRVGVRTLGWKVAGVAGCRGWGE